MRASRVVVTLTVVMLQGAVVACSAGGGGSSDPTATKPADAPVAAPPDQPGVEYIPVQVQGDGIVLSSDAIPIGDGGFRGAVVCSSGSPASQCSAPVGTTLWAYAAPGSYLVRFTTPGLPATTGLAPKGHGTYPVTATSPSPIIVLFAEGEPDGG